MALQQDVLAIVGCVIIREPFLRFALLNVLASNAIITGPPAKTSMIHRLQRINPLVCLWEIVERSTHAWKCPPDQGGDDHPRPSRLRNGLLVASLAILGLLSTQSRCIPWTISFGTVYVANALCQRLVPATTILDETTRRATDFIVATTYATMAHIFVCFMMLWQHENQLWVVPVGGVLWALLAAALAAQKRTMQDDLAGFILLNIVYYQPLVAATFLMCWNRSESSSPTVGVRVFDQAALSTILMLAGPARRVEGIAFALCTWVVGFVNHGFCFS